MEAGAVAQPVAVVAERIPVDLAGVEGKTRATTVGVLELQDGLLDFSRRGSDFDGDAIAYSRAERRAPLAAG